MKLSYRHANLEAGNESFLLRYQPDSRANGASCVLVDAGTDVNLPALLGPTDDLAAVCLTHAHSDHYQSLGDSVREETIVYASPPTAAILDDVMELAARQTNMTTIEMRNKEVHPIEHWTDLAPGISVHPVPAGHAPGAVGYLFQFADGTDTRHVLATGDFTKRRAAGYPGFDTSLEDIDVLFCTVAANEDFESHLSEGLGHALQRAHAGAKTLVATSGLLGVQVTYLLNELAINFGHSVVIHPVGHVATLYEKMDYNGRHVEPVQIFDDPAECLERGTIAVAGPEVPTEGSSGHLFHRLRGDPDACVVQLHSSPTNSINGGQCTVHSYETVNHPSPETLEQVHDEIAPSHTVIVHRHGGAGPEFNYLDSSVWAPTDDEEYTLYADSWQTPPSRDHNDFGDITTSVGSLKSHVDADLVGELTLPAITRHQTADLRSEGIDLERVEAILNQSDPPTDSETIRQLDTDHPSARYREDTTADETATGASTASSPTPDGTEPTGDATSGTTDAKTDTTATEKPMGQTEDSTENRDTESASSYHDGVVNSTGGTVDGIDPQIRKAVANGDLDPDEIVTSLKVSGVIESTTIDGDGTNRTPSEEDESGETPDKEDATKESDVNEATESPEVETTDEEDDLVERDESTTEESQTADDDTAASPQAETQSATHDSTGSNEQTAALELSALTVALAEHATNTGSAETVSDVACDAIPVFINSLLAGEIEPPISSLSEHLSETGPLADALHTVAARDSHVNDVEDLITRSVAHYLGGDCQTVTVPGLDPYLSLLDAVVANDGIKATSRTEVVALAVQYHVAKQNIHLAANTEKTDDKSTAEPQPATEEHQRTQMEYAKRYGDSWPENQQRQFLKENNVTAEQMGWTPTE